MADNDKEKDGPEEYVAQEKSTLTNKYLNVFKKLDSMYENMFNNS